MSSYQNSIKESLNENEILILLDFAESYSFIVQGAVQGYHWNNSQATLHPIVVYYFKGQLKCKSYCIISDHLKHDTNSVHAFVAEVLEYIKIDIPGITKCIYFSDGAGSQYKNYKNIANLCHHSTDHGVTAEWHFYATSHGKSPCDGIGGTVKRLVAKASLQSVRTLQRLCKCLIGVNKTFLV